MFHQKVSLLQYKVWTNWMLLGIKKTLEELKKDFPDFAFENRQISTSRNSQTSLRNIRNHWKRTLLVVLKTAWPFIQPSNSLTLLQFRRYKIQSFKEQGVIHVGRQEYYICVGREKKKEWRKTFCEKWQKNRLL